MKTLEYFDITYYFGYMDIQEHSPFLLKPIGVPWPCFGDTDMRNLSGWQRCPRDLEPYCWHQLHREVLRSHNWWMERWKKCDTTMRVRRCVIHAQTINIGYVTAECTQAYTCRQISHLTKLYLQANIRTYNNFHGKIFQNDKTYNEIACVLYQQPTNGQKS